MKYSSNKIRKDFISFFKEKQHKFVRSAPVLPINDPTLLFTNAGMNQFKDIFLNTKTPSYIRATNSQKCIRVSGKHNDLEEVGVDHYHHTFFEMLGNWSFGDYYKKEAIEWSWELLTKVWKLDKQRLWVTIFNDDDESGELWKKYTDVNPDRILKFDHKDNFWEMGETGPCGPCTEIHYYIGENVDEQSREGVNVNEAYREIWNLVFIQYNRGLNGELKDLPSKHVDTGAGFERLVAILNNKKSNYDTDLFKPIINKIVELSGVSYDEVNGIPHRVISDHIRMLSFSLADGVMPSNDGRGYVVRRVLRRACRFGRVLNMKDTFLYKLVDEVVLNLGEAYPELIDKKDHIQKVIEAEELSFGKTLDRGLLIIEEIINNLSKKDRIINGEDVFLLYDTYGFPVDLTSLIASEKKCKIDMVGYEKCMEYQKNKARTNQKFKLISEDENWIVLEKNKQSIFVGYEKVKEKSRVLKYRILDDKYEVVCQKTPFYAESGGQIGDTGKIISNGITFDVLDTYKVAEDICHLCNIELGKIETLKKNNEVELVIDSSRRNKIKANHTATHLLHKALKLTLGKHVQQAGSLVSENKLRFDLTHYEKISNEKLENIENIVNNIIVKNHKLKIKNQNFEDAKSDGAEALFGEKYLDTVRVVDVDLFSKELCGGTHVDRTGDIGSFKIISESSLASGVRRIEAVTQFDSLKIFNLNYNIVSQIKTKLQCEEENIIDKINNLTSLIKQNEDLNKKINQFKISNLLEEKKNYIEIDNIKVFSVKVRESFDPKSIVDQFLNKFKSNAIFLIGLDIDKPILVLCGTKDISEKYNLGQFVKKEAQNIGGGGGGPKHFGTSGFKDRSKFLELYEIILSKIKELN